MANLFELLGLSKAQGSSGKGSTDDAKLLVNGKTFEGWTEIKIKKSLKTISSSFELTLIDKWAEEQVAWQVAPNDECILKIGDETIITGYIDSVNPSFSASQRSVTVSGRDKACDLVDCSAVHTNPSWTNIDFERFAKILCDPFSVKVSKQSGLSLKTIQAVRINNGDTVFEVLDKQAKMLGVLLINDGKGGILITRAGTERAATRLVQGVNILSASASFDSKERFSKYIVKSQNGGYDEEVPSVDFSISAVSTDPNVKRYRPLSIQAEGIATAALAKLRASWEATFRAAKSSKISVSVYGWRQASGMVWEMNKIVGLNSGYLGINQDFLISGVSFSKGSQGTTTTLELERPETYTPDPTIKTKGEAWNQLVQEDRARR